MAYTTKKSLLEAIHEGNEVSWREFYDTYRPLVILRGSDFRLNAAELEDLMQMVLLDIFKSGKKFRYDRKQGRFRDYLRRIITHNAIDLIRKRKNCELCDIDLSQFEDEVSEERWLVEWQQHILKQAMEQLKLQLEDITFQAFEFYAIKEEPAENVAKFLKIPVGMVYVAKSRALAKLRKIVNQLREEE